MQTVAVHRTILIAVLFLISSNLLQMRLSAQQASPNQPLEDAVRAFEHGDLAKAEQLAIQVLGQHGADLRALLLMGAILDAEQRYAGAEPFYASVLKLAPGSASVLNNVANHYLSAGDRKRARELYLKALAIDAHHPNANLQLAQIAVDERRGTEALKYLDQLQRNGIADPGAVVLRARALALSGKCDEARQLIPTLQPQPATDFSIGLALADCKLYSEAETEFARALDADPRNFDVLYNLGLAALRAGHVERALFVFDVALKAKPEDPDCLYAAAEALLKAGRAFDAAALLTKAQARAPERPEIPLLLAQVSAQLEFYEDAAAAYEKYLGMHVRDDDARRERGFAYACARLPDKALPDLEWYVRKHPDSARGSYELAIAQQFDQKQKALRSLDRALALDPKLMEALYARGVLRIAANNPAAAIGDLRQVLDREPDNPRVLVRLGQAYLDLHRPNEGVPFLKRAMAIAPRNTFVLVQYRRALIQSGQVQEAAAILPLLKQTPAPMNSAGPRTGLTELLNLSPPDRRARYLASLRERLSANPNDVSLKIRLGKELLADARASDAIEMFRALRAVADARQLAECGRLLLEADQYDAAADFLEAAITADPSLNAARPDLAAALFRSKGPQAALAALDQTPLDGRQADYWLLRAQILDSLGRIDEAVSALNAGMRSAPTRAGLYLESAAFLLKHKLYKQALALLEQASRVVPDDRDLLFSEAVTLAVLRRDDDALKLLARIQAAWPEWDRPYLLSGIILEIQLKSAEARQLLENAIALGADTPEAYYYEALAVTHTAPDDFEGARAAITRALRLTPKDPYVLLLAGKIALEHGKYTDAIETLHAAIDVQPSLIPARYALRHAYEALGDQAKAAEQLAAIQRIAAQNPAPDQNPFPLENFLFTVRPPG